ncbi:hypothetical protein BJ878DRAFT_411551, partial [Calycina marina]
RLNYQHRLIEQNPSYVTHPSIPYAGNNLRIADFATKSAIWLLDVAKIVDLSCTLEGFE